MTAHTAMIRTEEFQSLEGFSEAVREMPVPWELLSGDRRFSARIARKAFADIDFAQVSFSPCECVRPGQQADDGTVAYVCLTVQQSGVQQLVWGDCDELLAPNELILWDSGKAMMLRNQTAAISYNFWLPRSRLERRMGDVSGFIGRKLSARDPGAALLGAHMDRLFTQIDRLPAQTRENVFDATIDLIFACIPGCGPETSHAAAKPGLLADAKAIMARSDDLSSLGLDAVAAQLGIGRRTLQQIFAHSGTTFSAHLAGLRLDRARRALVSGHFRRVSITEIAHHFGFFDSPHFNRAFKQAYGMTPTAYRNLD